MKNRTVEPSINQSFSTRRQFLEPTRGQFPNRTSLAGRLLTAPGVCLLLFLEHTLYCR